MSQNNFDTKSMGCGQNKAWNRLQLALFSVTLNYGEVDIQNLLQIDSIAISLPGGEQKIWNLLRTFWRQRN